MATIGSFQKTANGFSGRITGLMFDVSVEFQPNRKDHDKAPDYRILAPFGEIGAAWNRTSAAERAYLSVKLDDPGLPAPVYASLVLAEDKASWVMIWTR